MELQSRRASQQKSNMMITMLNNITEEMIEIYIKYDRGAMERK